MPNVFSKTAKQTVEARIDDFIDGPSATSSNAIHDVHVRTTLGRWWNFEKEVRERLRGAALNNRPLQFAPRGFLSEFHTSREQLVLTVSLGMQKHVQAKTLVVYLTSCT